MYRSDSDSLTGIFQSSDKIDSKCGTHEGNIPDLQAVQDVLGGGGSTNGTEGSLFDIIGSVLGNGTSTITDTLGGLFAGAGNITDSLSGIGDLISGLFSGGDSTQSGSGN